MMSQLKCCDDGLLPERLLSLKHPEENDPTQIQMYTEPLEMTSNSRKRPKFAMPESIQNINNDRLQTSENIIQDMKLSVTSAQDSTRSAKGLFPFWNEYTLMESKRWWLPKKTACVTLDLNS